MSSNMYRDQTIDPAKARHLQTAWNERVKTLAKQTAFSEDDLQALCLIFHKICEVHEWWGLEMPRDRNTNKRRGGAGRGSPRGACRDRLDRPGFRDSLGPALDMPDSAALDALFNALDPNNKRYVTMPRWVRAMSALRGTDVEKAIMCWSAYTARDDGVVSRNDMAMHARSMFPDVEKDDFEGFCKEFVDAILKDTKAAKEGFMTLPEFLDITSKRPLFREFLMDVLPSRDAMAAFLATFSFEGGSRAGAARPWDHRGVGRGPGRAAG